MKANIQNSILNKFRVLGKPDVAAPKQQKVMPQRQEMISAETKLALQERQRLAEADNSEDQDKPKRLQGNLRWMHPFGEEVTFADLALADRW